MIESISHFSTLNDYNLSENQIDIWQFSLITPPANALYILNEDENKRAQRFHFERHQRRFTAARAIMRLILSRYSGIDAKALEFNFNKQGKPAIQHPSQIQFNLSHSGEMALLAVGKTWPMGIDLELFSARPYLGIAKSLFSAEEITAFEKTSQPLKVISFFHLWAQKEAFIKASGLGLSYPTTEFSVSDELAKHYSVLDKLHHKEWQMLGFMPAVGCCAALCCELTVKSLRRIQPVSL